jgi:hypothetical protein
MRRPSAKILEKRGYFWWHGEETPEGRFAPATAVPGVFEVGENGLTTLNVEGSLIQSSFLQLDLPSDSSFEYELDALKGRSIVGKVDDDQCCVYLRNVAYTSPGRTIDGKLSETYQAGFCLVGNTSIPKNAESFFFSVLSVGLAGLEEWRRGAAICLDVLNEDGVNRSQEVRYTVEPYEYEIDGGRLVLRSDIHCNSWKGIATREVTFRQHDWLDYFPIDPAPPEDLKQEFGHIEEFLAILTGSYYSFDWPQISARNNEKVDSYTLYFHRNVEMTPPPEMWNLWTVFPQTRESLGALYSEWKRKRREYGPGFYLYLGALRSSTMYIEHRFVNLIWGIESLHRVRNPEAQGPSSEKEMIEALLAKVEKDSNSQTRRWLRRQIEFASEPTLMDRIIGTFGALPWSLERNSLNKFAERCAARRNDISHYGGPRKNENEGYEAFLTDLITLSEALGYLYHAALLREIGLDEVTLRKCYFDAPIGHRIKIRLEQAGLTIDKSPPPVGT